MTNTELITVSILEDPLYKKRTTKGLILQDTIGSFEPINYQCDGRCQSVQTFELKRVNGKHPSEFQQNMRQIAALTDSSRVTLKYIDSNTIFHLDFICLKCNSYQIIFTLLFNHASDSKNSDDDSKGITTIQKTGQIPPQESTIDDDVKKWLTKADKDLYLKGMRSEMFGFGIGAFGYFRRIVENNIEKLLDQLSAITDDKDLVQAITLAKQQRNAEEKLKIVKDHAPGSFSYKSQNVFKILYNALSEGLHKDTDEECLDSATGVRTCLDFLIKRVHRSIEEQKQLTESIIKLTN